MHYDNVGVKLFRRNSMTLSIHQLQRQNGADVYYDADFRVMIETHLTHLREHEKTQTVVVDEHRVYRQESDFYGLLLELDVQTKYHWIILRVNGYEHPSDYVNKNTVIMPAVEEIERLKAMHLANKV